MALTFLIAVAALIIAILAYKRSGGSTEDLKRQVEDLRHKTGDVVSKVEKSLRGEDKTEQ